MRHLRRLGHCLAAGAIVGAAVAALQLLLWPEIHLSAAKSMLAMLAWASWGGLWVGLVFFGVVELIGVATPYLGAARGLSLGLWRWLMSATGIVVTALALWNRFLTRELLPPESWHNLGVAASVAALFAIVMTVLAARRSRRRRPWLATLLAPAILVGVLWGIWIVTPAPSAANPTGELAHVQVARRLLFVSWEGTDLPWLLPAIERGDMPFLRMCRDGGAWGQVRTVHPYSRHAALATLVTGCAPSVHAVLGRRAYRVPWLTDETLSLVLDGPWREGQQLPWKAWERTAGPAPKRAALWSILELAGDRVGVAGWPRYASATWVVPPPLASDLKAAGTLDADLAAALRPALAQAPARADETRIAFARAALLFSASLAHQKQQPVEALLLNTRLAAEIRPLWTSDTPGDAGEDVLRQAAHMLDEQLRSLWLELGAEETLLVVASPFGMAPAAAWRRLLPFGPAEERAAVSPADATDGFVLLYGPGVNHGTRLRGGRLADVAASVLYLLGLPVARDMAGRVLLDAVTEERAAATPLRLVPSYPATPSRH